VTVSDFAELAILDAIFNSVAFDVAALWCSLHDGDPAETGTNEVTGGSYARVDVTTFFDAAASGSVVSNANIEFTDMPAVEVVAVGFWDASTVGNHLWNGWLTGTPAVRGVFSAEADDDILTAKGHGLADTDQVVFSAEGLGVTLPTGLVAGTVYHVIATGLTTDAFEVSATPAGAAVNITVDGNGSFTKIVPKTTNSGDTLRIASTALTVSLF